MPSPTPSPSTPKVGFIFLGRRRPGFDQEWGRQMEDKVRAFAQHCGFAVFEPAEKAVDDASFRRGMDGCLAAGVDAVVLLQTTMGDGRLTPSMAQLWPDPVILWATPEKPDGDMISSCSLVGTHNWGSVLAQMDHPFELVYGDPAAAETGRRFAEAVRMAVTVRRLRTVRLGLVGGQAPGYFAMSADPFAIHAGTGAQVQTYSLVEFGALVNDLPAAAVEADVAAFRALGIGHKDTVDDDLAMASRLYLAMRGLMESDRLDALTIRCWPEMANVFGQWPYVGVARLAEEGRAVSIEGDADGALGAWIVQSLGLGHCYLSDWLEHDAETITLWHVGAAPLSLCKPVGQPGGPRFARHFNIRKPAILEADLRENMPVTVFRFWRRGGKYFCTAREGVTIPPRRHLMATNGLARMVDDPREWFDEIVHAGMPHHVSVVEGRHAALLRRFAVRRGMQFV